MITDMPTIEIIKRKIENLRNIKVNNQNNYEAYEKKDDYHQLEFTFTDNFRIGIIFDKISSKRKVITELRTIADKIEKSEAW